MTDHIAAAIAIGLSAFGAGLVTDGLFLKQ